MKYAGWLLDAGTEHERAIAGSGYAPSMGGMTAEPMVLRSDAMVEIERMRAQAMQAVSAERERWVAVVTHAVTELEALDDETAQAQAAALRELLGPNKAGIALDTSQTLC